MTEEPGQLIAGRYLLGRCLARGGMGSVWETEHIGLEARVALKLLRPELGQDEAHIERFRREARAAAKLKSPHVVGIYDCGVDRGTPYIAMEFLEGEDLELRLGRLGRLDRSEALLWLDQAARGLAVAHAAGLVHRDVKPANLFIERLPTGERLKVVDFGIARQGSTESTLTTGGGVWGSPAYMSPEQARGRAVDQRTDVWALAGVFYRMLTGRLPFQGLTEHDTIVEVCTGHLRPPSEIDPSLPAALDDVFARALAKDPSERTLSVELLAQEAAEAMDTQLSPFDAVDSRPSGPPTLDPTRPPHSGPGLGRVTETKPLAGESPASPTKPASPSDVEHSPRRHLQLGLLAALGLALLLGALSLRSRAPEGKATPDALTPARSNPEPERSPPAAEKPEDRSGPQAPEAAAPPPQAGARKPSTPTPQRTHAERLRQKSDAARTGPQNTQADAPTDPLFGLPLADPGSLADPSSKAGDDAK